MEQLFAEGKKLSIPPFRVLWLKNSGGENLKFGVGVSVRNFKKAVDRNRIKRLIKESWRLQKNGLKELANNKQVELSVFINFTGKEVPKFTEVKTSVGKIIEELKKIISV